METGEGRRYLSLGDRYRVSSVGGGGARHCRPERVASNADMPNGPCLLVDFGERSGSLI